MVAIGDMDTSECLPVLRLLFKLANIFFTVSRDTCKTHRILRWIGSCT